MTRSSAKKLGYIQVGGNRPDESLQRNAMDRAGVKTRDRYVDRGVSASTASHPGLDALLNDVEPGQTIYVYKLGLIGRSTAHVAQLVADLTAKGVFIETPEGIDSATATGKAMLDMLAIVAEMERAFVSERTRAGLAAAKLQGRKGGRPKVTDPRQSQQAQALRDAGDPVPDIARTLGVSVATIYRITSTPAPRKEATVDIFGQPIS